MVSTLVEQQGEKPAKSAGKRKPSPPETPFFGPRLDPVPGEGPRLAGKLPPDQFWALVEAYPNKEMLVFYLYRQWPIINRKQADPNNPKNVAKYSYEGGDLRKLIHREFGSGEYGLKVVDPTKPTGQQRLAQTEWTFNDPDMPPQLDVEELTLGHPRNRSYEDGLRRQGKLKQEVEEVADTATEQLGSIANRALDELAAARKKPEPVASSDSSLLGIVQMLFTQQQQAAQQQTAMMMELFKSSRQVQAPAPPPAATSLAEQLALLRELREAAADFSGGSARPVKSTLMEHVISALAPSLPHVLAVLTRLGTAPAVGAAPVAAGQVPAAVPEAAPVAMVNHPIEGVEDVTMKMGLRFMEVGQQALKAFERGRTGDQFAEALETMADDGAAVYEQLHSVGFDGIMQVVRTLPAWSILAAREAEVQQFVREFLTYGEAAEEVAG
ncbi:MAG: hypothetical protein NTV70_09710 [Acidobacteria bacterium]|nr:hypothetical protein [Acidobacteriota bacterium]